MVLEANGLHKPIKGNLRNSGVRVPNGSLSSYQDYDKESTKSNTGSLLGGLKSVPEPYKAQSLAGPGFSESWK
ncbi:hypothetical protein DdX_15048 [Ditylenchus destructor]|uniref:Uncharacterized protein n=1 Tax=Ditylenchus destructor TaxID=166010 RepID=A0AAD4MSY8_9BILA|nr:hypothetical protein DdX_15048 [Ditylenchus destructor]